MPNRNFDKFLQDNRLVNTERIDNIRNFKIGIDANVWLKHAQKIISSKMEKVDTLDMNPPSLQELKTSITEAHVTNEKGFILQGEPLQQAMGGIPLTLRAILERDLDYFNYYNIKPYFVFNGLTPLKKEKPFSSFNPTKNDQKNNAWLNYYSGKFEQALATWISNANYSGIDVINSMIRVLHERKVDYFRAPFHAAPQLQYLESSEFVHFVYSSYEAIIYGLERVITSIDFDRGTFDWIDKTEILKKSDIIDAHLIDAYILSGFDSIPLQLAVQTDQSMPYKGACKILNEGRDIISSVSQGYVEYYYRSYSFFKVHPVFNFNCQLEPVEITEDFTSDLSEIYGVLLPLPLYFFLSQGLVSPQILNNVISKYVVEFPPNCLGETKQYRQFLESLESMRSDTFALLANCLEGEIIVKTAYWYEEGKEREPMDINERERLPTSWNIPDDNFFKRISHSESVSLVSCLQLFSIQTYSDISKKELDKPHENHNQILAFTLCQLLEMRGFFDKDHRITNYGKLLLKKNPKYQQELFIAIELIKKEALNGDNYDFLNGQKNRDIPEVLLLTRVFSMIHPNLKSDHCWSGIVDLELLCFNSILKSLVRTLRNLTETLVLTSFLTQAVFLTNTFQYKNVTDLKKIYFDLPFIQENNCGLGLLLRYHLLHFEDPTYNISILQTKFKSFENTTQDLLNGVTFFHNLHQVVKEMAEFELIPTRVAQQFDQAAAYLEKARQNHF